MRDSESDSDSGSAGDKEGRPVMFCQTADGGLTKRLVRGAAPSTPRRRRNDNNAKRRLSELMFFRCTPEDKATIESNAAIVGVEKSSYMRAQSTGKPIMKAYRRIRADWDELQRCMGVINKAGNVVNQLVVELRRFGGDRADIANKALSELINAARAIVAVLREL
jgi:hypothetical protein